LAGLSLFAASSSAQAMDFEGQWRGQGSAVNGDCPAFDISVSVQDEKIVGIVNQGEHDYRITGSVSKEGQLRGEVSYLWVTIAELAGDLTSGRGEGTWTTFKGPSCEGKFAVQHIPGGVDPQLANRPDRTEIEELPAD
jgi:hypothetical protein